MAAASSFVAAALLLLGSALAQTTQPIDKVVPTLDKVQSSLTIGPGVGVTPSSPSKRRRELLGSAGLFGKIDFYDNDLIGLVSGRKERRMQQVNGYQVFGQPAQLSPEFSQQVLGPLTGNGTTSGSRRHLLQATTQLTFYGTIKQGLVTDRAIANYVFNQDSLPFLKVATQSGTTFTFLKALLILPQEQTATNVPPYVTSTTGFVPKDLAHPTIVRLNTQGPTSYAPQVALRFDYSQTVGSPLISMYYTDRVGTADQGGLPLANLNQTFNLDLAASHP
ncbi:g9480 [Coccomyxa elongata]